MSSPLKKFRGPAVRPDYRRAWARTRLWNRLGAVLTWSLFFAASLLLLLAIMETVRFLHGRL